MKKLLMTALLMTLMTLPARADTVPAYGSDFSSGTDGFYARSMGTAALDVSDGTLTITGRTQDWNSMGRDFALTPGETYELSVQVRQDEVDTARFVLSVAHKKNGQESYENIAFLNAKKGEWLELRGAYTPGPFDSYVLYVETLGAPQLSYSIRDFQVFGRVNDFSRDIPSLKEAYKDHFPFGTAVTILEALNTPRMDFYASQFNILTPGNELKPDSVLDVRESARLAREDDTAVAVHLDAARPMLDYAFKNSIPVHGHVLVWHSQTPAAFFHEGYDTSRPRVSREVMLRRLENYISGVFALTEKDYPGLIVSWDVVNEAIDDSTGKLRKSPWLETVGDDYISRAFEYARKYAPQGVRLYYNDYNTAYEPKQTGIVNVLETLIKEGTIDGYGFQMHHDISQPSYAAIKKAVDRVAATGLKMRISELDVTIPALTDENLDKQAALYKQMLALALSYEDRIEAVQVWGVTDDLSWRAKQFPLLFNADYSPKKAFYSVLEALEER